MKREGNMNIKKLIRIISLTFVFIFLFNTSTYATAGKYSQSAIEEARIAASNEIVEIARAEIGFYECGINKYTDWYYGRETESSWCCIFVSWCASQAGVIDSAIPQRASCDSMRKWFKNKNEYYSLDSGYFPKKGDIVFYNVDVDGTDNVNHVEIVTENGYVFNGVTLGVKSIGGNTSNINYSGSQYVTEKFREIDSKRAQIVGFAHPSYEKGDWLIGKMYSFSDEIRDSNMRFIHSKYISLIIRIENFWYDLFHFFDDVKLF